MCGCTHVWMPVDKFTNGPGWVYRTIKERGKTYEEAAFVCEIHRGA